MLYRPFEEDFYDRVCGYRGTFDYEKALRKRRVWVEPLFAEAKDWYGMRWFRLQRVKKVNIEALLIAEGQNVKLTQAAALRPPRASGYELRCAREHRLSCSWWPMKAFFKRLVPL